MTWADLKKYIAFNEEFLDDMWRAERARKTPTDVSWSWQIPAKYRGYTQNGRTARIGLRWKVLTK